DRIPLLNREVFNRRHVLNAGIVDENIEAAKITLGSRHHAGDLIVPQHVGAIEGHARAVRGKFAPRLVDVGLGAEPVENDVAAGLRKRVRHAKADTRCRPGHERGLAFEGHAYPLPFCIGWPPSCRKARFLATPPLVPGRARQGTVGPRVGLLASLLPLSRKQRQALPCPQNCGIARSPPALANSTAIRASGLPGHRSTPRRFPPTLGRCPSSLSGNSARVAVLRLPRF